MAQHKVWFVTGTSRGFGRLWTEAALERGDKVVATAREPKALDDLVSRFGNDILTLRLDVTDPMQVSSAVHQGFKHFGRLDVIVSNAGYGAIGMVEEVDIETVRRNFETNFFGTLSLIKAVLPLLRAQGSGHIIPVSSGAGLISFATGGIYGATKYAVNGLADSLSQEVTQFGIKVTIVEPGPFATGFSTDSLVKAPPMQQYDGLRAAMLVAHADLLDPSTYPDPATTIAPLLKTVDMERPPLHLLLGNMLPMIEHVYADRLDILREGAALSA